MNFGLYWTFESQFKAFPKNPVLLSSSSGTRKEKRGSSRISKIPS
ncbi:hypothetical protein LEP1GSC193_1020 [Leptospira alstonii serovar Pingchang str. 80-412]|uniref:Uncharacterized protein n=2 Tax=Leptospira alstonii TaxID=28452 RepID=M6CP98_9LEPT|nr:hypothetical protein LEP1GSC194_1067 [Leptospira alstonii serovar Sichuan str. 79601]EQA82354.1 hypothetical protein LEP1GSC193_1020 [Leptospira alstonii serovar Pingchang str. 80-412]